MLAREDWNLATPPDVDPRVATLCAEFGVTVISKSRYRLPGKTRPTGTIRRLIDKHDAAHARLVLCMLAEGRAITP
jgi:hypothetical protein